MALFLLLTIRKTLNSCETAGTPSWPSLVSQLRWMGFPDARPLPLLALQSDWLANQKLLDTRVPTNRNPLWGFLPITLHLGTS